MYPEKGMIAVDMDPIMRPCSIRDRIVGVWYKEISKENDAAKYDAADTWTAFVEQVSLALYAFRSFHA
jgi:hypothetical protein